ncbi:MAG: hypothetical protein CVV24_12220 [Ignavibacteriae bacterium HGW-Ignavibacteriae-3]|nr:MAG: hypothetical protein CVV24_12220 [Ignavibacteriae bacterium HGW-Ignavibacteriae-3]
MNRLYKILTALLLVFSVSCTQYSEIPFPDGIYISINNEPVTINLKYNQEINIEGKIILKFEGVGADSRCGVDVVCVWAGDGEVFLKVSANNSSQRYTLHTNLDPREISVNGYVIQLVNLFPAPRSDRRINQQDYNIDLRISKIDGSSARTVQLIDASNMWMISKDLLNVTDVTLEDDFLNFTVGYSGGCREHRIELFALKEIAKSNPAQVSVHLSHFANGDMCEAYITKKEQFDLTPLKQLLKSNYGITDRVILIISDTSGRPIRNPAVEYKL